MAIFRDDEVDWRRLDYTTIVGQGLATVTIEDAEACCRWLEGERYTIVTLDCDAGFTAVVAQLSTMLR